ncbi:tripartite tricarboxylate transporter substrate binding protein [Cupriavidus sp. UYPR2.512]|uniref:tripartite tricarboxylate transporter substrate binding protein n=1 Tax=Cupriavidus sp. UYPR2.512 TaxID=1080187 RepID=UPI0003675531|nr:tripartite tricarboxylate transporter substrate binding protein [Cupriavidus sp. UYPR2.512]UIF84567.1 tripartite tricarboxylate transporter substrate binding protein [Cupriavidus necator]
MKSGLHRAGRTLGAIALAACAASALAQGGYPNHPVRIIVPWPAGGGVDTVTRTVAEKLTASLGQQFVVDNRPGATGNIGAGAASKATPDGYTLLVASAPMAINASLQKNLPFDLGKDFAPLGLMASSPYMLVVNPSVAGTVKELVARAKAEPGKLSYASVGPGTQQNVVSEVFKDMARVDIVHAPYKGGPQALTDMVGGHIHMMFHGVPAVMPFVKGGQLKGIAVASKERLPLFPEIPTMAEAGFPGIEASEWYGLVAPAGTPKDIVALLGKEIEKALNAPGVRQQLASKGYEPASSSSPDRFATFMAAEQKKWALAIKQTGFRLE